MSSGFRWLAPVALLMVVVLAGCANGDERASNAPESTPTAGSSAKGGTTAGASGDAFCEAWDAAATTVQGLVSDVNDGDFTAAQDDLTTVKTSVTELISAGGTLAVDVKNDVQPTLNGLESTMQSLDDASSPSDLVSALGSAATELDGAIQTLSTTANCP